MQTVLCCVSGKKCSLVNLHLNELTTKTTLIKVKHVPLKAAGSFVMVNI